MVIRARRIVLSLAFFLFLSHALFAQIATKAGTVYGRVMDQNQQPLAEVTVLLECDVTIPRTAVTGSGGSFRFAKVPPAICSMQFSLPGYHSVLQEDVRVSIGSNMEFEITLTPITHEETRVLADSPLLDRNNAGISYTFDRESMEQIPNGRDVWFLLNLTPGIATTRLDTGAQSAFQPTFFARGGRFQNNTWTYDGLNHNDPGSPGFSSYYDFEAFEEIQISTAGNNASIQTGGVAVNLVTIRPGNQWDGNASIYGSNETVDYGFNGGGPLRENQLFVWGAYRFLDDSSNEDVIVREASHIKDWNLKLNYNWNQKHTSHFGFFRASKEVEGRDFFGNTAPEALHDQNSENDKGRWTLEHTWIPNDDLLTTVRYGYSGSAFAHVARGGTDVPVLILCGADCRWESTAWSTDTKRPAQDWNAETNYFLEDFVGGDHEFKFGFEYRTSHANSFSTYGNGSIIVDYFQTSPGGPLTSGYLKAQHAVDLRVNRRSVAFHFTDTFRLQRFTLNAGLRFDHQTGWNDSSSIPAVVGFEDSVGAFHYPGGDPEITTDDFSPRIGVTFDLTSDGKTLLRGNLARYYDAFDPRFVTHSNPTAIYNGAFFGYVNSNGDRTITRDETEFWNYFGGWNGSDFDLEDFLSRRLYDSNLSNAWTNEFLLGIERELSKDIAISAMFTYRQNGSFLRILPNGISTEDYVPGGVFTSSTSLGDFSVPYFILPFEHDGTAILKNIRDYKEYYRGLDLVVRKRMSNNVLFNAGLTLQRQWGRYNGGDSLAMQTESSLGSGATYPYDPTNLPFLQDKPYALSGGGSVAASYPYYDWALKFSGVYLLPWEMSAGTFIRYQQGYPYILMATLDDDSLAAFYGVRGHLILLEPIGSRRYENLFTIDFQIQKSFNLAKAGRMTALLSIFNLTNAATVTVRNRLIDRSNFNEVDDRLSPRSYRLGIRYSF